MDRVRGTVDTSETTSTVKIYDTIWYSCSARPPWLSSLGSFALLLQPLSFSPHLFPALLLWLPVSSWPDAQPPLGSIPHPSQREERDGRRGREEEKDKWKEWEKEPQRVSLYRVWCYSSVTSLRGRGANFFSKLFVAFQLFHRAHCS